MSDTEKTDNGNLGSKLALRRHFLSRYHAEGQVRVLDCCAGDGVIWTKLRKEFKVDSYFPLDRKPKAGRIRIDDSARITALPGLRENVIDVDTYGVPWKHFIGIVSNLAAPLTVFLTIGHVIVGRGTMISREEARVLGLNFRRYSLPMAFNARLLHLATERLLALPLERGIPVVEAQEIDGPHVSYIGLRLGAPPGRA